MSAPVHCVAPDDDLQLAQLRLSGLGISSLAVVDEESRPVGVISMTDLIHVGREQAISRAKAALLTLPDQPVSAQMTSEIVAVAPDDSIETAARCMLERQIHRIYVVDAGKLTGVLSTRDVMLAIRDKRVNRPIEKWMSSPAFTIRAQEPISLATERLEKAHVSGLVVLDGEWPVGLFTQRESLESRSHTRDTPVEEVMSSAMLSLESATPIHRAAAQAAALRVRRVIATRGRKIEGILTGLDFVRAAT